MNPQTQTWIQVLDLDVNVCLVQGLGCKREWHKSIEFETSEAGLRDVQRSCLHSLRFQELSIPYPLGIPDKAPPCYSWTAAQRKDGHHVYNPRCQKRRLTCKEQPPKS